MVIGGNKKSIIDRYPILKNNSERFHEYLNQDSTRLMVIGYSFGDEHINQIIVNAVNNTNLGIFIIDPKGIDVIDTNRDATIYAPSLIASTLWPRIVGASRRPLTSTFDHDHVEHSKIMRFFSD
jgi:hypothetical protein